MADKPSGGSNTAQGGAGEGLKIGRYKEQRAAKLDHILRRIHNNGLDSLCQAEVGYLDRSAAELRFELGWSDSQPEYS